MKKFLISIFTLIFIISMVTIVNAASGTLSATSSNNQVTKGNTFTVTISANADAPIDGFYTKISYDTSVLSLENQSVNTNYSNNSGEGEIFLNSNVSGSSPTTGTLDTLTFKVLDSASVGDTTISFSGSELHLYNNGTDESVSTSLNDVSVKVISDETTVDGGSTTKTKTPSSKTKSSGKSTSSKSSSGNSSSKKTLPQTGVEVVSIIGIAVLSTVAIISYVSYRKYKNV